MKEVEEKKEGEEAEPKEVEEKKEARPQTAGAPRRS